MPNYSANQLPKYQKYYSEEGFWDKVKNYGKKAGIGVLSKAFLVKNLLKDPNVSTSTKVILYGALGYFILPVDLIPDFIAGLGYTDDTTFLSAALAVVGNSITDEMELKAKREAEDFFG